MQSSHRQNLIEILLESIREKTDEDSKITFPTAATRVLLQWMGYDADDLTFVDSKDRGVDAWIVGASSAEIFQVKTHLLDENDMFNLSPFNFEGISDLARAKDLLLTEHESNIANKELKALLRHWASLIRGIKLQGKTPEVTVTLHLVILGFELTDQANLELQAFQKSISQNILQDGVSIRFFATLHTIGNIINRKWQQDNKDWRDRFGQLVEDINLTPWNSQQLIDNHNAVFYCRAIDLVNAYELLGYQLFEPNVRANIVNSRVNQEIQKSVSSPRSRKDFRFLNNGVTITCQGFKSPRGQNSHFTVHHPGIVNGLQTVVALHTAYQQLPVDEKEHFEETCSVLVRLLQNNAVEDINQVVKATNNQNPMKPRNLMSNTEEQLTYCRLFASELGWFYEAKEGAWAAFEKDPRRWRPKLDKHPKDFYSQNPRKVRRIDNEELAQTWLAFIGFAFEAANEKKGLFEDRFYNLMFTRRTIKHGFDYGFSPAQAKQEAAENSPNASLMLVSYLCRRFAEEVVIKATENRNEACQRLGISSKLPPSVLNSKLSEDSRFMLNQVLAGMSLLFTEYVGFVLYRAFNGNIHERGQRILKNGSFNVLANNSIELVKSRLNSGDIPEHDVLLILWQIFVEQIEDRLSGTWGDEYRAAPVKIRYTFAKDKREKLYRDIEGLDQRVKRRVPMKLWAIGIEEGQRLFEFIRYCID